MSDDTVVLPHCDGCGSWLVESVSGVTLLDDGVTFHCRCGHDHDIATAPL